MGFRKLSSSIRSFHGECRVIFNNKTISKTNSFVGPYQVVDLIKNGILKLFEYSSAVRGYHYYHRYWQPQAHQKLKCVHEKDNP